MAMLIDKGYTEPRLATENLTLRDYFAAMAMQGFWASGRSNLDKLYNMVECAERAYQMADLMIRARENA